MPKGKPRSVLVRFFLGGLGVLSLALGTVPLLGRAWHVLYGDTISYQGWRMRVPEDFGVVQRGADTPTMWRFSFGIPLWKAPYGHLSLFGHPDGPLFFFEKHYQRFAGSVAHEVNKQGYVLVSRRTLPVDGTSVYCLEFARSTSEPNALVRCAIEGSTLFPWYEGDKKYLPDFYGMLQGMSLETKSR